MWYLIMPGACEWAGRVVSRGEVGRLGSELYGPGGNSQDRLPRAAVRDGTAISESRQGSERVYKAGAGGRVRVLQVCPVGKAGRRMLLSRSRAGG